ncbi:MAG: hypothetical protein KC550_04035 [Nanoarchaeota archaeon]|nr:hypothetical protein [Nanoarchaeota archaeon]
MSLIIPFPDYKSVNTQKENRSQKLKFENGIFIGIESLLFKVQDLTSGENPKIYSLEEEINNIKRRCGFVDSNNLSYELIFKNKSHLLDPKMDEIKFDLDNISQISSDLIVSMVNNDGINEVVKDLDLKNKYDEFSKILISISKEKTYGKKAILLREMDLILKSYSNFFEKVQEVYV